MSSVSLQTVVAIHNPLAFDFCAVLVNVETSFEFRSKSCRAPECACLNSDTHQLRSGPVA
jgi:hypothetical protein